MNEKTKNALIVAGALVAVIIAGYMGWNALKDNSEPVDSPSYAKLTPEERARIRAEGLAIRNGKRPSISSGAPTSQRDTAPAGQSRSDPTPKP